MPLRKVADLPRTSVCKNANHNPPEDIGVGIWVYECPACLWVTTISRYPDDPRVPEEAATKPERRPYPERGAGGATVLVAERLERIFQEDLTDWHLERLGMIEVEIGHPDGYVIDIADAYLVNKKIFAAPVRSVLAQSVW